MTDVVTLDRINKRFDQETVIDGLSFSVHQGEIFGFLGPFGLATQRFGKRQQALAPAK